MPTNNIKVARRKKELTQTRLAEMLGVKAQAINNWERCRAIPNYDKLKRLSEILEESIDYLLEQTKT